MRGHVTMLRKRSLTFHEKRVRFFTVTFGGIGVLSVIAFLWLLNRSAYLVH